LVFDPLALVLILAANQSKEWDKEDLLNQEKTKFTEDKPPVLDEDKIPEESEPNPIIVELPEEPTVAKPDPHPPGWMFSPLRNDADILKQFEKETITSIEVTPEEEDFFREQEKEVSVIPVEPTAQVATETTIVNTEPTIEEQMADTVDVILSKPEKRYQVLEGGYIEVDGKLTHIINLDSEMMLKVDGLPSKTGFGTAFPKYADVGNVFVRVDNLPHKVFKYNGVRWIEQVKETSDTYLTDDKYLQFVIDKIGSGEFDPDILTEHEQEAIETFIKSK